MATETTEFNIDDLINATKIYATMAMDWCEVDA